MSGWVLPAMAIQGVILESQFLDLHTHSDWCKQSRCSLASYSRLTRSDKYTRIINLGSLSLIFDQHTQAICIFLSEDKMTHHQPLATSMPAPDLWNFHWSFWKKNTQPQVIAQLIINGKIHMISALILSVFINIFLLWLEKQALVLRN